MRPRTSGAVPAEVSAGRRARLSPEARGQSGVFEQAFDVAMQVVQLREQHELTQADLAARCGIDQGDISRIERGATSPTARTLQRIADALGADGRDHRTFLRLDRQWGISAIRSDKPHKGVRDEK